MFSWDSFGGMTIELASLKKLRSLTQSTGTRKRYMCHCYIEGFRLNGSHEPTPYVILYYTWNYSKSKTQQSKKNINEAIVSARSKKKGCHFRNWAVCIQTSRMQLELGNPCGIISLRDSLGLGCITRYSFKPLVRSKMKEVISHNLRSWF